MTLKEKKQTIETLTNGVCEAKVLYTPVLKPSHRACIAGSADAYTYLRNASDTGLFAWDVETMVVVAIDRRNCVIGHKNVGTGGVSGTVADPKVIFQFLLLSLASGFILAHNHPSGKVNPSQSDIDLTRNLKEIGKLLEIRLLDHLIVEPEKRIYFSFADEGML
jgi:DNA repair protein RadC